MKTEIRRVAGRPEFRRFIDYAYDLNAADPRWIPELRISARERLTPTKNPFFEHADVELFLAYRDGAIVGRIAAIEDRLHNQTHGEKTAMFGFYEAADADASRSLLAAVEAWAAARGLTHVRGPINPSLNESVGLLIDGFDTDPMLLMPRNPPAYATYIESAGYAKVKDLYAWIYDIGAEPPPVVTRLAERLRNRHRITVRPLNVKEFDREADRLREIYCSAWERNWGFVAPTPAEFRRIAHEMKPIFDPQCTVCAEVDGRMIACAVAVPDVNQALKGTDGRLSLRNIWRLIRRNRYIDQVRLLLLGIDADFRTTGLYPLLLFELHRQLRAKPQYKRAEFSWILEDNRDINQPAEQAGAKRYQTYRVYEKAIG
ncbi:MAG TPA: hypothetical protein VFA59_03430 [Vicinamibacterales bacterium]|nr:hypothetical protein [Vicinamibacterales bacterium]